MDLKSALTLVGTVAGSGGTVGLVHATPTILGKSGLTCRQIGVHSQEAPHKKPGVGVKGKSGGGANLREVSSVGVDNHVCYKK